MAEARSGSGARKGTGSRRAAASTNAGSSARTRRPAAGAGPEAEQAAPAHGGHVCPVAFCPVGMALTFAEAARPEVVQHLMAAGQELMLAVKAMIDARVDAVSQQPGFEHIRIR